MYVTTREDVGQAPMLSGFFSETLGKNVLAPEIQAFLKQIRDRPQDHKKLLLTVTFHPNPIESNIDVVIPFKGWAGNHKLFDLMLFTGTTAPVDFLDELRQIRDAFRDGRGKANESFRRQIDSELRLRNTMFKTTGRLVSKLLTSDVKVSKRLEPFFLAATDPGLDISFTQAELGLSFAQKMLPEQLARRIIQSEASEAHLTFLGRMLIGYAELFQKKDSAFKQLVEQERKKRLAPKKKKP